MIAIRVVSRAGVPLTPPLAARFGETIGDIGRGQDCTLVLPDPERKISRKQALITWRAEGHFIRPIGTNLYVELDGEPLAPDAEYPLGNGAEIRIGPYLLRVEYLPDVAEPPRHAPLARTPAAPPAIRPLPPEPPIRPLPPEPPVRALPPEPPVRPLPPEPTHETDDPLALFGRKDPRDGPRSSLFRDLLGAPTAAIPVPTPTPPGPVVPRPPAPAVARGVPPPPRVAPPPSFQPPPVAPVPPPAARPGTLGRTPEPEPPTPLRGAGPNVPREVDIHVGEPTASDVRRMRDRVAGAPAQPPPPRAEPAPRADDAELNALIDALYAGLNMPVPGRAARSPKQMRLIGELLREAIAGTLDLLAARTIAKRELGAASTLLQARENNPLKFSPDVDAALSHLLGPPERGFIGPQAAVRDAFGDLRAHQIAVLAGMRAALDAVLARFDPSALEVRLAPPGMWENLVPATRRAKLWENYSEQYAQILREVEGDFDTLFGRAFLQAYKAQLAEFARARDRDDDE